MAGRALQKAVNNREKFVMTLKLLSDESGKKMGKSEGNAVFLDQGPEDMYGAVMSWTDGVIAIGFELATRCPMEKIEEVKKRLKSGENPRNLKMEFAWEMVRTVYGEGIANNAQEHFVRTIQNKEVPDEVEIQKLKAESINITDLLVITGLAKSKSEAKRLIKQSGIKLDGEVVENENTEVDLKKERLLQRGKRQYLKVSAK
jgi:tyrosyl-tRNA synthetase